MERKRWTNAIRTLRFLILLSAFLSSRGLYGQVDTGAIRGTVTDQSNAVVPSAKVALANEDTGSLTSTVTGADGSYTFAPVKIGNYTVSVEMMGFQRTIRPHVKVDIQRQVVIDFTLAPGTVTQTLEVIA